jgi:hypothetical protein
VWDFGLFEGCFDIHLIMNSVGREFEMKRSRKAYCFYAYEMKIDDEEGEFVGK